MPNYFETTQLPLYAADFDYFRIPSPQWELMLIRLKQLGFNLVTLSIPWGFHEFNQGTFDLKGVTNSRRNLLAVMHLCQALNFDCLLNLGPYHPGQILGDGLPLWLLAEPEEFETTLTTAAENWFKALSKHLTGFQWPDGPIVAVQVNSEPPAEPQVNLSSQLTEVKWRIWLRRRYQNIDALNAAYGSAYQSVNDVKFPLTWAAASTPLEKDAAEFLNKVHRDRQHHYAQILVDAGWEAPIYPTAGELQPELPALHSRPLTTIDEFLRTNPGHQIVNFHSPIQVAPQPVEIGPSPSWADQAPIRADGSVRRTFWQVRQHLWLAAMPKSRISDLTLQATFDGAAIITCQGDTTLKLNLPTGEKPAGYRLRLNGELLATDSLKVSRGKLSGSYQAEDEQDQTDLILLLANPNRAVRDFPATYLITLLAAQSQALTRSAALAARLGQLLTLPQDVTPGAIAKPPAHTLSTLEEARRGLRDADAALRKAMSSIGGLEHGMAAILDKERAGAMPQPAAAGLTITPDLFEGPAKDILVDIGTRCLEIVAPLNEAAASLQQIVESAERLTVKQYQRSYTEAVTSAGTARQLLLEMIARLRLGLGRRDLPLALWSVHDQVQELAETIRWGVCRS